MHSLKDECRLVDRLTLEVASGAGLTPSQRDRIAAHLADCASCRAEESVAQLIRDVGDHGAAAPLDELTERRMLNGIMDKYEAVRAPGKSAKLATPRPRLGLAAAALVLALVGAGLGIAVYRALQPEQTMSGPTQGLSGRGAARVQLSTGQVQLDNVPVAVGQLVRAGQTMRVREGRTALVLPADSAVMLERDSTVRLDRLSAATTALTLKRGAILATVRPRTGRPKFTVRTRAGRIEVTGTVFWVESSPQRVVVAVLRGQVRVVEPGQPPRVVSSGQRTVLGARALGPGNSAMPRTRAIDAMHRTEAWRWVRALELITIAGASPVSLRSRPSGAQVLVDELLLGETPLTVRLSPGHHRLELRKPGYVPVIQWMSVPAGKPLDREVALSSLLATGSSSGSGAKEPSPKRVTPRRSRPPWSESGSTSEPAVTGHRQPPAHGGQPATKIGAGNDSATLTARELSTRARALRAKGDFKGAAKVFAELLRRYPRHRRSHTARVSLGLLLLDDLRDARGALQQFTRYLSVNRLGALAQEAAYGRIRALRRLGRRAAEIRRLQEFLKQFPLAVQTSAVRRRLRALGIAVKNPPKPQMGLGGTRGVK